MSTKLDDYETFIDELEKLILDMCAPRKELGKVRGTTSQVRFPTTRGAHEELA